MLPSLFGSLARRLTRSALSLGPLARTEHIIVRNSVPMLARTAVMASASAFVATAVLTADAADCHCQVPCGIFDDPVRVALMKEHAATCRKAMSQVKLLTSSGHLDPQAFNQASRWVTVKEESAQGIISIVADYLLAQRVKKVAFQTLEEYHQALELHHELMQSAMKVKQSCDVATCDALDHSIADVGAMYTK